MCTARLGWCFHSSKYGLLDFTYTVFLQHVCELSGLQANCLFFHCVDKLLFPNLCVTLAQHSCHYFACRDPLTLHTADLEDQAATLSFAPTGEFSLAVLNNGCSV